MFHDVTFSKLDEEIVLCKGAFTEDQLSQITNICKNTLTATPFVDTAAGEVLTSWIPHNAETSFMYKHMAYLARKINEQYFKFDLDGFIEKGLMVVSYADPGQYLEWHTDKVNYDGKRTDIAKLTLVLELNDPLDYDGCHVRFMTDGLLTLTSEKGLVYAMPGYVSHCVTPLVSGTRNVLVAWLTGPDFR